jgi:hypothetical protein
LADLASRGIEVDLQTIAANQSLTAFHLAEVIGHIVRINEQVLTSELLAARVVSAQAHGILI